MILAFPVSHTLKLPHSKIRISCDQFLITMFSLGMSIGKKHHALNESLSKSIWCNPNNNITCYSVATYTAKLFNHTVPNKGTQVIDSPASTFKGLGYKETAMVNSYN